MKILNVTTHLNIGGVTRYVYDLSCGLKKKGIKCFVASAGGCMEKEFHEAGIPVFKVNIKTKFEFHPKLLIAVMRIAKFVKRNNIDIIHAHTRVAQIIAGMVSIMTGVPFVSTCHGFFKYDRFFRKLFPCWGKRVIAISEAVRTHLMDDFKVPKDAAVVIYNGIEVDRYYVELPRARKDMMRKQMGFNEGPIIGTVGRLSPVKGHRYLLHAMREVHGENNLANLLIIGDGPYEGYLKKLSEELGLSGVTTFVTSQVDLRDYYSLIDIYVFPSIQEGLGLALLEAMASSRACIATAVGGISNVIDEGKNGLLVPPAESHLLAEKIKTIMRDKALANSLRKAARESVEKKFPLEKTISETVEFYEGVINKT